MAGHAQLKFVMTECSKTQIRLTRPIYNSLFRNSLFRNSLFRNSVIHYFVIHYFVIHYFVYPLKQRSTCSKRQDQNIVYQNSGEQTLGFTQTKSNRSRHTLILSRNSIYPMSWTSKTHLRFINKCQKWHNKHTINVIILKQKYMWSYFLPHEHPLYIYYKLYFTVNDICFHRKLNFPIGELPLALLIFPREPDDRSRFHYWHLFHRISHLFHQIYLIISQTNKNIRKTQLSYLIVHHSNWERLMSIQTVLILCTTPSPVNEYINNWLSN